MSALTLSHATVRRRRATKKRKSRGNSTPRESVAFHAERGGRIFATPLSRRVYFLPRPLVFMDGTTVPNDEKGEEGIFKRRGNRIRASAVNFFMRSLLVSAPRRGFKESAMVDSFLLFVPPSPSYRRRDDYFRGATVNEAAVTRSKVNPKHVNDFQEGCVHTSLPSIRNSRDHRFRGEQPLRGEDYAISPVPCAR